MYSALLYASYSIERPQPETKFQQSSVTLFMVDQTTTETQMSRTDRLTGSDPKRVCAPTTDFMHVDPGDPLVCVWKGQLTSSYQQPYVINCSRFRLFG